MTSAPSHPLGRFYAALGHATHSALGVLWIDVGRFSLTSVPYADTVEATQEDVDALLWQSGKLAAVFPTPLATGVESTAFWVRGREYGRQSLQRQFFQHVRRGAKECEVRSIDWATLRTKGRACTIDTLARRGILSSPTIQATGWERMCEAGAAVAGLEAWGCFHGDDLLAYLISWSQGETCEALIMHRAEAAGPLRATNLLLYEFTRLICQRPELESVSMGRDWLPTHLSIARFKSHAGYQAEPIRVAVVLHPAVRRVLGHASTRAALALLRQLTGHRSAAIDNLEILAAAAVTQVPSRSADLLHGPHARRR